MIDLAALELASHTLQLAACCRIRKNCRFAVCRVTDRHEGPILHRRQFSDVAFFAIVLTSPKHVAT